MNPTKEQMLEWLEMECVNCNCAPRESEVCREQEDIDQCLSTVAALEALIESGIKVTTVGERIFSHYPQDRAKQTEGSESSGEKASGAGERPRIPSASELPEEWRKQLSAIDGKPIPPAPAIKKDLTVGPKEAMRWLVDMEKYWSVNDHDGVCIVVIKAALRPKVVSRGWVGELVEVARWGDKDGGYARVKSRLCSELGIVVGEKP